MRFLSVAERELRAAARHKLTHRARWLTAAIFFAALVWLVWAMDGFKQRGVGPAIFQVYAGIIFFYCLLVGAARTADCLSWEKREGTLGLLFLTNLNSAEIIAGKLCSSALATVCSLFSIFPMLALPLLLGGTTGAHFWMTVLALVNAIFFSLAVGFVASTLCQRQFTSVALATALALGFGAGLSGLAAIMNSFRTARLWAGAVSVFCPFHSLLAAKGRGPFGANDYWASVALVAATSLTWLLLTTWHMARTWRDRPKTAGPFSRLAFWRRRATVRTKQDLALRRRLLNINPFFWLGGRQRISAPVFMLLVVALIVLTVQVTSPFFARLLPAGPIKPLVGFFFAWLWTGLAIHALVLYYGAMSASQPLAEDKQTGALELVLSTPTTVSSIARGLWLAYGRRMLFPALAVTFVHLFFIWQGAVLIIFDPPTELPPGITPVQLLWHTLMNEPVRGFQLGWEFRFMLQILLLFLAQAVVIWFTLGWLGRWLGLRMKRPGFAPMVSLGLVLIPPLGIFSVLAYTLGQYDFFRLPERLWLPMMVWLAFALGTGNCTLLSLWAARRFRHDFRTTVTGRFQPPEARRWLPTRCGVTRFAIGTAGAMALVVLLVAGFYGYQNARSRRAWSAFRADLKQRGESLELAPLMPAPVPDAENFVRSAAFQNWLGARNREARRLYDNLQQFDVANNPYANNLAGIEWTQQRFTPLSDRAVRLAQKPRLGARTNRTEVAPMLLTELQAYETLLRDLAAAVRLPSIQFATNRDAHAVLGLAQEQSAAFERAHAVFQLRACAYLAAYRSADAGEDLLTCLQFARLARQLSDARATTRTQILLARSLQPLWEGLAEHQWNEAQLAAFQRELGQFNLLADFTNAVRRVVRAHIELWQAIPESGRAPNSVLVSGNAYQDVSHSQHQPLAWWFDDCILLHQAGQAALAKVDVAGERVQVNYTWRDLGGVPVGSETEYLLQQYAWWGSVPGVVAFTQTAVNEAIFACALERYRLAHGVLPQNAGQLVPAFLDRLPRDTVRGIPLIYQRVSDQRFIVRGVGPNGVDDRQSPTSDDWLWSCPTNTPAAAK